MSAPANKRGARTLAFVNRTLPGPTRYSSSIDLFGDRDNPAFVGRMFIAALGAYCAEERELTSFTSYSL